VFAGGACYKGGGVSFRTRAARVSRRIVTVVVVVVGAATVLGLLDRFFWVFELADLLRLQYLVVLGGAALAALALRRPRLAGLATALAVVNVVVIGIPFTAPATAASPRTSKGSLRLLIANVEVGNRRFSAVERLIQRTEPDVVGVIELTPAMAERLRHSLPQYRMRRLAPRDDAYGIGVFSRLPLLAARIERFPSDGGPPTVVARVRAAGEPVTVVVTHVHTPFAGSIHVRQLQALASARPRLGGRLAICGDFNTVPWAGPFRRLAGDARLTDLYGDAAWSGYSWPTWNALLRVPLDNCLVSDGLAVTGHRHGADFGSDHFPLVVDVAILGEAVAECRGFAGVSSRRDGCGG
jgi:endonuclease/exonuclease/phosphatase (EEP) superfamily protein YafD